MKTKVYLLIGLICLGSFPGFSQQKKKIIYQYAPISSLLEGVYDGNITALEFKKLGNLGIGTLNTLDGEMLVLNDTVFQVRTDGIPVAAKPDTKIPFGTIVNFISDQNFESKESMPLIDFQKALDSGLISDNLVYAFKISGEFPFMRVRSVPAQSKPYPRLIDAIKKQVVFEYKNIKGTLVGFKVPKFMDGVNVPGYHFHFISDDRKFGGHVLDCTTGALAVQVESLDKLELVLPDSDDFLQKKNVSGNEKELKKIESLIKEK